TAVAIAATVVHRNSQRLRRLPVGPMTFLAIECLPSPQPGGEPPHRSTRAPSTDNVDNFEGRANAEPLQGVATTEGACASQRLSFDSATSCVNLRKERGPGSRRGLALFLSAALRA